MKKCIGIGLFLSLVAGTLVGFYFGTFHGKQIAFRMTRTEVRADMATALDQQNKQLFEYLKARYYYLSNRSGIRLRPDEGDFGPVDAALIKGFSAGKGPTSFEEEYEDYKRLLARSR